MGESELAWKVPHATVTFSGEATGDTKHDTHARTFTYPATQISAKKIHPRIGLDYRPYRHTPLIPLIRTPDLSDD